MEPEVSAGLAMAYVGLRHGPGPCRRHWHSCVPLQREPAETIDWRAAEQARELDVFGRELSSLLQELGVSPALGAGTRGLENACGGMCVRG